MNDTKISKGPRAMRILEEFLHKTPNGTNNLQDSIPNLQVSIPLSTVPPTPASSRGETIPSTPSSAIPPGGVDSKFLKPTKIIEREEGEILSSRTSSATPPNGRKASPLGRYSTDRTPPSPEPVRHRLPISRSYLPPSPHYHISRSSLSPELSRGSHSPIHTRRPLSPDHRANLPSSSHAWKHRRRSSSSSRSYHPSRSPISPRFPPQRRASEHDAPPDKSDNERRGNGLCDTDKSRFPDWQKHTRNVSVNTTSSDHRTHSHEPRRGSMQDWRSDSGSSSMQRVSTHSISSTNNSRADSVFPESGQDWTGSNVVEHVPSTPKSVADAELLVKPCHNVPGLWMVKFGADGVEIVTCEFEIDEIAADRWGIRDASRYAHSMYSMQSEWTDHRFTGMAKKRHMTYRYLCHSYVCRFRRL